MRELRIVYMGTPDFAVYPLQKLLEAGHKVVAVVTNPDKPAGRGQKIQESPVKKFAVEKGIPVLQPERFRDERFLEELRAFQADLQLVVAFKMLPEVVWNMPPLGTVNLHASLLPDYRGAAPINWAVMNGETCSGVTTFLLKHEIDTGNLIFQERVEIGAEHDGRRVARSIDVHGCRFAGERRWRPWLSVITRCRIRSGCWPGVNRNMRLKYSRRI